MSDKTKPWEHPDWDDNPEWTEEDFAKARPASEVHGPEIAAAMVRKAEFQEGRGYTREDWDTVSDPHVTTPEQAAQAKPFREAMAEAAARERDHGGTA